MISLNIIDDSDFGGQCEKRLVVLVRLNYEDGITAEPGVPGPGSDAAASDPRGIQTGGRQRFCRHCRRRCLAVSAGDGDDSTQSDCGCQRIGTAHDRNSKCPRPFEFRVIGRDGCGHHDCPDPTHMAGIVTGEDNPARPSYVRRARHRPWSVGVTVAARDRHTPAPCEKRQSAHPGASDPHEMNGARVVRGKELH